MILVHFQHLVTVRLFFVGSQTRLIIRLQLFAFTCIVAHIHSPFSMPVWYLWDKKWRYGFKQNEEVPVWHTIPYHPTSSTTFQRCRFYPHRSWPVKRQYYKRDVQSLEYSVRQVTSPALQEPTSVAALSDGRLVVADNAVGCVFIIDNSGNESTLVGSKSASSGHLHLVNAVYCTPNDEIIVCDHRLQVH